MLNYEKNPSVFILFWLKTQNGAKILLNGLNAFLIFDVFNSNDPLTFSVIHYKILKPFWSEVGKSKIKVAIFFDAVWLCWGIEFRLKIKELNKIF